MSINLFKCLSGFEVSKRMVGAVVLEAPTVPKLKFIPCAPVALGCRLAGDDSFKFVVELGGNRAE